MTMVQHVDREALAMDPVGFLPIDLVADAASELAAYVATGEGRGRAGGYAIRASAHDSSRASRGDYLNVVGLPVTALPGLLPGLMLA